MTPHATSLAPTRVHIPAGSAVDFDRDIASPKDLENLCRLVIGRYQRLKQLLDMSAPEVIVRNEKRMLRAAVDALVEDDEIALTIAHIGVMTFKTYFEHIVGIAIDVPGLETAADSHAV